jgi:hypothetical protein
VGSEDVGVPLGLQLDAAPKFPLVTSQI